MEERIPLLSKRFPADGTAGVGGGREEEGGDRWWSGLAREAGKVGSMALPMAAMSVAQNAVQVASNMMVGHLPGVLPLSASAIATSLASVSGFSLLILVLLSGLLPNPELESSVLSICLTTTSLMYTIPYGLGGAASTRVANELGAGNPEGARSAVHLVMSIAGTEAVLVTGMLFAAQRILGYAYSSDEEVVTYFTSMVPFVCISVAADSLQGVLSGIARGCGWQHLGAYVNLGSFYLVGIPVALLLGFGFKMEGKGLWLGIACGSVLQFLLLAVIAFFSNWQKMAEKARERIFGETPSEKQHLALDATNSV
uniref:Protein DETOXIFICATION n=1 Tax=Oryza nivara TaxID=4536 RepID=A0A0E0HHW4_ORYNI